jgi:DNA-binding CsgD family transcriptional regulator
LGDIAQNGCFVAAAEPESAVPAQPISADLGRSWPISALSAELSCSGFDLHSQDCSEACLFASIQAAGLLGNLWDVTFMTPERAHHVAQEIIGILPGALDSATVWDAVSERLHAVMPGSFASINGQDFANPSQSFGNVYGTDESNLVNYIRNYAWQNPWNDLWVRSKAGTVISSERSLPASTFKGSAFYEEWLKPLGDFEAGTGIKLESDQRKLTQIVIHYPLSHCERYQPFIEAILAAISAPMVQTLALCRAVDKGRLAGAMQGAITDRLPDAAIAFHANGTVLAANCAAQALLSEGTIIRFSAGRLLPVARRAQIWLEMAQAQLSAENADKAASKDISIGKRQTILLPVESDCLRMTLNTIPFWTTAPGHGPGPFFLLTLRNLPLATDMQGCFGALARHFQLTGAELRLCELLASGQSLDQIAAREQVALGTVRARAKMVLAKTRTKRQAELVTLLHLMKD